MSSAGAGRVHEAAVAVPLGWRPAMHAVVITKHGGPDVLRVEDRPDPPMGARDVRIAVLPAG